MDAAQVERLLAEVGVDRRNPALWAAVIRFVQRAEGNLECFGSPGPCAQRRCAWRSRCQPPAEVQAQVLRCRSAAAAAMLEVRRRA